MEELIGAGLWPLAALVFFASIVVPGLKLIGLVILLVSTQRGSRRRLRDRTRLYRIVDSIGRWSMIDIFMGSILVALLQFGIIARVTPGFGAVAFAAVVILTMAGGAELRSAPDVGCGRRAGGVRGVNDQPQRSGPPPNATRALQSRPALAAVADLGHPDRHRRAGHLAGLAHAVAAAAR